MDDSVVGGRLDPDNFGRTDLRDSERNDGLPVGWAMDENNRSIAEWPISLLKWIAAGRDPHFRHAYEIGVAGLAAGERSFLSGRQIADQKWKQGALDLRAHRRCFPFQAVAVGTWRVRSGGVQRRGYPSLEIGAIGEAGNAHSRRLIRGAGTTWAELRDLKALAPEDSSQPERMAAAIARCQAQLK